MLWRVHRALERGADEALVLTFASAAVSLLAFTFLTRMHERYLFLALATLAPLVVVRALRLVYAGLSALFLLSLWYPYAFFNTQWRVRDAAVPAAVRLAPRRVRHGLVAAAPLVGRGDGDRAPRRVARHRLGRARAGTVP